LDFDRALNFCIDFAIEKNIDFFLFAGDAYKTANPSPTQQKLLMQCFLRLYKAGIPIVIIVGNHDNPVSYGKANALDIFGNIPIDGFHVISKPISFILKTKSGPVQIVGIPWPSRNNISIQTKYLMKSASEITDHISQSVGELITHFAKELNPLIPAVLTSHLTVSSGIFSGSEKRAIFGNDPVLLPSQLAIEPFDYVALGHLHRYQNLNEKGFPAIVYSGSIERVDFGERKEDKGFCFVTIEEKGKCYHEFIKTPMRPFIQIEAHLEAEKDQTEQLVEIIKKYDIKDAIVKVLYYLPIGTKDSVNLRIIQQSCEDAMFLVGIIPIRQFDSKQKRTSMKVDMDLCHLLNSYFESKPEYKNKKDVLTKKALELQQENQEIN
jgi:exonuclease SbcD